MGAPIPACVLPPSGPAAWGQPRPSMANGAWTGNLSQTAIDRKPLQTDKLTGRAFDDEVYAVVAQIPAGKIVSYKQIARLIGMPDHARRVGRAMASAPAGLPCHRVVNSAGRTAPGWPRQRELLEKEGVRFKANGCADIARFMWEEIL
jgi:methylated-DNA-protein-cysteine methyltransferase-like protein